MVTGFLLPCLTWTHSGAMIINLFNQEKNHFYWKSCIYSSVLKLTGLMFFPVDKLDLGCLLSLLSNLLQGTKIFGKESLRYVPLIGWAWYFTESIFLKRQWDQDRKIISREVARIINYPDGYWITVRDVLLGDESLLVFRWMSICWCVSLNLNYLPLCLALI